jgi:hypothetical protein
MGRGLEVETGVFCSQVTSIEPSEYSNSSCTEKEEGTGKFTKTIEKSRWMLNGTLLSSEGLPSAPIATEGVVDEKFELNGGGGLNVGCETLLDIRGEIKTVAKASATTLSFGKCKTPTANCEVPATLATVPVEIEFTLDGTLAIKGNAKPQTGTTLATIKFSGEACALAGVKSVTGAAELLAPEGQDERTDQLLKGVQAATGQLKFSSNAASFVGSALILLANRNSWSFL